VSAHAIQSSPRIPPDALTPSAGHLDGVRTGRHAGPAAPPRAQGSAGHAGASRRAAAAVSRAGQRHAPGRSDRQRVLLVEDNPGDARLVREALSEREAPRFEVTHVPRLAAAAEAIAGAEAKPDYLKIDGMFVRDMVDDRFGLGMVKAINDIGHEMGLSTIAGFVESDGILSRLRALGVDYAQGYGVGPPRPIGSLESEVRPA